ncbi:MAG: sugar phosphate isomerase/epimerase family protein [Oscillospiraceae bacterium]
MVVGAQLYTIRAFTQSERDFEESMRRVAAIGYKTVQVSAIGPIPAEKVREICDKHGLQIVLTHTNPDRILNDTEAVIKEHDVMGCKYIGIGMMPERYRNIAWLDRFITDYKEPAKKVAAAGKRLMYHNHAFEFSKMGGKRVMETLMEGFTPEEMGVTLDTFWVQIAGGDVIQWIEKLGDRIPCVHLKDLDANGFTPIMAPVMEGNINFDGVLETIKKIGKTEYLLVEQDDCYGADPFACLKTSYDNLAAKGWK